MKNELRIPKGVDIVDFLGGVPSGTITDVYVHELPNDLMSIQALMRVGAKGGMLHFIKE